MSTPSTSRTRGHAALKGRRTNAACRQCRHRKVRCPGGQPCANCSRGSHECEYDTTKKIFVSEDYVRDLERKLTTPLRVVDTRASHITNTAPALEDLTDDEIHLPTTHETVNSAADSQGGNHFVGPSSTWGFAWRARKLLATLPSVAVNHDNTDVDDVAYKLLGSQTAPRQQDAHHLPRESVERYLSNYRYNVGSFWHFVNLDEISREVDNFQTVDVGSYRNQLRGIQFNLVMAIGRLLEHHNRHGDSSPGMSYFYFALSNLDQLDSSKATACDPILVAQNLCLVAFYFHAINMRNDAYMSIGKAMRIAFTQGVHRMSTLNHSEISADQEHRVRFWWSLYALDMVLTSLMGAPVSVHEDEITTLDPSKDSRYGSGTLLLQNVKLARLTAIMLREVYGTKSRERSRFARSVGMIMAGVDDVLNGLPPAYAVDFGVETWHISRSSATLYLMAFQLLIVTIRPVLFRLLEQKVSKICDHGDSAALPQPGPGLRRLLRRMVDAATTSIRILSNLHDQGLLQVFLAFDATVAFSSAVVLSLGTFVASKPFAQVDQINDALHILKELGDHGNIAAAKRHNELELLHRDMEVAVGARSPHAPAALFPAGTFDAQLFLDNAAVVAPSQAADHPSEAGSTTSAFDTWDNLSFTQTLMNEDTTEAFNAFFHQIDLYPELIAFPDQTNF